METNKKTQFDEVLFLEELKTRRTLFISLAFHDEIDFSKVKHSSSTHSANFDKKVHKPQSNSYGRIVQTCNFFNMNLNNSISASII